MGTACMLVTRARSQLIRRQVAWVMHSANFKSLPSTPALTTCQSVTPPVVPSLQSVVP